MSCCNENIQYGCFKKLRCGIKRKLKFNGANNCIPPSYLTVCFTNSWNEFIFMKRIKKPRAESCDVMLRHHCLHKMLAILGILWLCPDQTKNGGPEFRYTDSPLAWLKVFFKSTGGEQPVCDIPLFTRICLCVCLFHTP